MSRCQICGRRKGLRQDGTIVHHYVAGVPCMGIGHPPIESDDAHLAACRDKAADEWRAARDHIAELLARRVNWIDPRLERRREELFDLYLRLQRRLDRHRAWPARFRRQMERDGYGMAPPAYLLERESHACSG